MKVDPVTAEVGNLQKNADCFGEKKRSILHGQFDGLPVVGEETNSQVYTCIYYGL